MNVSPLKFGDPEAVWSPLPLPMLIYFHLNSD